ncbi:hypothetical protein SLS61_004089 [Didymella pomorum]
MGCAEVGSATWLMFATKMGMPVSTTQTIVGALVGVGFATNAGVTWGWESGYVSQIAASWVIAPLIAFLVFSYIFFMPFLERKLVKKDARLRIWRIPLGPLLKRENPPLNFAGKADGEYVKNYYADAYGEVCAQGQELRQRNNGDSEKHPQNVDDIQKTSPGSSKDGEDQKQPNAGSQLSKKRMHLEPHERFIGPVKELSWANPKKFWGYFKFGLLQGVTRDVITHDSDKLRDIHACANRYDVRIEHMWTYRQVVSAMMMSIAHGSNDVANAVGPWSAVYRTHIMRALGNKITQMSPTRGFATELGAAITVLLASRLGLPVSTTQCLTGALIGTALMNYDLKAVNWAQLGFIFMGWVVTLPASGLIAGILCVMALNTPHF